MALKYYAGDRITGTASDKNTLTSNNLLAGTSFLETDTSDLYHWDGDSWELIVGNTVTETLSSKTLTTPTVSSTGFANANHAHAASNSGGAIAASTLTGDVVLGSKTSGNYVATITGGTGITSNGATSGEGIAHSISVDASQGQIVGVGALDAGSITSNFGNINIGASTFTTTGAVSIGNLTVTGTTTTVNAATTTYVDPIITLQTVSGGGALTSDTNKDVGLAMQYHTGSAAKTAFLGFDDTDGKLVFIPDATISSEVTSGSVGTIKANLEGNVSGNITGTAAAGTLTGNTLASGVTASSLTTVGTLTALTIDGDMSFVGTQTISNTSSTFSISANGQLRLDSGVTGSGGGIHINVNQNQHADLVVNSSSNIGWATFDVSAEDLVFGAATSIKTSAGALTFDADNYAYIYGDNSNNGMTVQYKANRSGGGSGLVNIDGLWNNTTVARISIQTGGDTTNKDDAHIAFQTASAGSVADALVLRNDKEIRAYGNLSFRQASTISASSGALTIDLNGSGTILNVANSASDWTNGQLTVKQTANNTSLAGMDVVSNAGVGASMRMHGSSQSGSLHGVNLASAGRFTANASGGIIIDNQADAAIYFADSGGINMTIDSAGNVGIDKGLIIGHTAQITTNNGIDEFQILGTGAASNNRAAMVIGRWSADVAAPGLELMKSRHATVGSHSPVLDNDRLGEIKFVADVNSEFTTLGALIRAEVEDASPAQHDMGAAFVWQQGEGGGVTNQFRETMRLNAAGKLGIDGIGRGEVIPNDFLHVVSSGASTFTAGAKRGLLLTDANGPRINWEDTGEGANDKIMSVAYENENLVFGSMLDDGNYDVNNILVLNRDGKVGIGVTPTAQLHVVPTSGVGGLQIAGPTHTAFARGIALTETWNAGGSGFQAIYANITDTASDASSELLHLGVGGTAKFSVRKDGQTTIAGNVGIDGDLTFTGAQAITTTAGNLSINAYDAVVIKAGTNGNVQIQNENGQNLLDVEGNTAGGGRTWFTMNSSSAQVLTGASDVYNMLKLSGHQVNYNVSGTPYTGIQAHLDVGELNVQRTAAGTVVIEKMAGIAVTAPSSGELTTTLTDSAAIWIRAATTATSGGTNTRQYGMYVENINSGGTNYALYTAGTAQSYFGGPVGIGLAPSNYPLNILSTVNNRGIKVASNTSTHTAQILITNTVNNGANHSELKLQTNGASSGDARIQFDVSQSPIWTMGVKTSDNSFRIEGNGAGAGLTAPDLTIAAGGNVGIGDSAPTEAKLHVANGAIGVNGFRLTNGGGMSTNTADWDAAYIEHSMSMGEDTSNTFQALNVVTKPNTSAGYDFDGAMAIRGIRYKMDWTSTSGGNITGASAIHLDAPANSSSGTLTNYYTIYAAASTIATNNYGLYIEGASMKNYLQGNLGIGTSAPTDGKLVVQGDNSTIRARDAGGTSYVDMYSGTGGGDAPAIGWSNDILRFWGHNANRMQIDTNGRVAIGENIAPDGSAELQVRGGSSYQLLLEDTAAYDTTGNGGHLQFRGKYHSNGSFTDFCSIIGSKENNTSNQYGSELAFLTRTNGVGYPEKRMTINASGNVGIGTATPTVPLQIKTAVLGVEGHTTGIVLDHQDNSGWHSRIDFMNSATSSSVKSRISGGHSLHFYTRSGSSGVVSNDAALALATETGDATFINDINYAGDLTDTSDERVKGNIQTISGALGKIAQMRGVSYNRLYGNRASRVGLVAQELELIAPELVKTGDSDSSLVINVGTADEATITGVKSVNYSKLTAYLIEAIKELKTEVDILKAS